jgi:predicted nucleic acid-binding protein
MKRLFIFDTSVVLQAMLSRKSVAFVAIKRADNAGIIVVSDATLLEFRRKNVFA